MANGQHDLQDHLQEGEEAEGQEGGRGAHSPLWGQRLVLVNGLELLPLEEEAPVTADPPAVVPGVQVQGAF